MTSMSWSILRSWKVFQVCFVEACVVDTDPPFFVRFLYHHYVGEPLRVVNFPYELGFKELLDLLAYRRVSFKVEPSLFLDDRLVGGVDVELVDND